MKIKILLSAFVLSAISVNAQSFARLDINHFNAGFNAAGDQLSQLPNFTNNVSTPYNQITYSIANLWIGGYDAGNQLHMSAQTYRQTGTDFWPGALDTTAVTCSVAQSTFYNKVWKINKTTIDSFRQGLFTVVPSSITSWPGNGNASAGEGHYMAPFVDVDGDGIYNYAAGDYPKIRGDQALWFVYNDHLVGQNHTETNALPLGLEIRCMAYAVACDDSALANTIFLHYDILDRSTLTYDSVAVGLWTDLDVGSSFNNGVGSDSLENDFYYYSNYFAAGAVFLNRPMVSTMTYDNNFTVTGNPQVADDYYGYLRNRFKDGTHLTYGGTGYGGTDSTMYFCTGNPFAGTGWLSGAPVDRRMMGATAPMTWNPATVYSFDMAYVACYDPSMSTNLCVPNLRARMQSIKTYYSIDQTPCGDNITLVPQETGISNSISAFPNPANSQITIQSSSVKQQSYFIYNVSGQEVMNGKTGGISTVLDIHQLPEGMYFIRVGSGETLQTLRFIKVAE